MDASFWQKKWETNDIGFHEADYNPGLTRHLDKLGLNTGNRVFVPLCGKTRDIRYLMEQGLKVVGAELSELAVKQLFESLGITPMVEDRLEGKSYTAQGIQIFVGDLFALTANDIGKVEAIYDRAALVALPGEVRQRYTQHLCTLTGNAPQLLICFEYDQSQMDGPPFSVPPEEVKHHYSAVYRLQQVQNSPVKGGLKGRCEAMSQVWLLQPQ